MLMGGDVDACNPDALEEETSASGGIVFRLFTLDKPRSFSPIWKFRKIARPLNEQPAQEYFILPKSQPKY